MAAVTKMSSEDGEVRICDIAASIAARGARMSHTDDASMARAVRDIMDFIKAQLFVGNSWTANGVTYWRIDLSDMLGDALAEHGTRLFDALRGEMIRARADAWGYNTDIATEALETGTVTVCTWRRT